MKGLLSIFESIGEGLLSIFESIGPFSLFPPPSPPLDFKILSEEEARRKDAEAIRKDWEAVIGKWDEEMRKKQK